VRRSKRVSDVLVKRRAELDEILDAAPLALNNLALTYNPHSTVTLYFLAETLLDMGRKAEARVELQKVLDAPFDPEWTPEDHVWKAQARTLLARIK